MDSEDSDAPILAKRESRSARASVKSYSISSDEDGGSEGDDEPLSKQAKGSARKGKSAQLKKAQDDDHDDLTDLTAESPKKKAKAAREPKVEPKAEPKVVEEVDDLDDEEEELLLKLMSAHSSTSASSKMNSAPSKSAGAPKVTPASAKRKGESGVQAAATPAPLVEDVTLGSARVETSKIKFSRSVPVLAPNAKKISRTTFLVQCEDPALDFEGDSGVIGTVKSSSESSLQLDIKGQLFEGSVLPCNSMMVVDVGASEVKIEALMNNFVQLHKIQNPHDDNMDVDLSDSGDDQDGEDDEAGAKSSKSSKAKSKDKPKAKAKAKASKGRASKKAKASKGKASKKA